MLLTNKKISLIVASLLLAVGLICFGFIFFSAQTAHGEDYEAQTVVCADNFTTRSERINCWMGVVRLAFEDVGTERAFEVFESLYTNYEDLADAMR